MSREAMAAHGREVQGYDSTISKQFMLTDRINARNQTLAVSSKSYRSPEHRHQPPAKLRKYYAICVAVYAGFTFHVVLSCGVNRHIQKTYPSVFVS
jgi:hypothetical protein